MGGEALPGGEGEVVRLGLGLSIPVLNRWGQRVPGPRAAKHAGWAEPEWDGLLLF